VLYIYIYIYIYIYDISRLSVNPFVTSGTYMSHLQRVFSRPLG